MFEVLYGKLPVLPSRHEQVERALGVGLEWGQSAAEDRHADDAGQHTRQLPSRYLSIKTTVCGCSFRHSPSDMTSGSAR